MVVALVCLWIGFAVGFVCAALLAGRDGTRRTEGQDREVRSPGDINYRVSSVPVTAPPETSPQVRDTIEPDRQARTRKATPEQERAQTPAEIDFHQ